MALLIAGHILFTFKTNLEKGVSYKKAVDIERTKELIRLPTRSDNSGTG